MKKNDIIIIHGTDYKDMTMQILQEAHLEELIQDKESAVALKPNLVTAVPPSGGATTHAELLAGTVEYLKEHHFHNITVMEGSWAGGDTEAAFYTAGYDQVCKEYDVPFINLQRDTWTEYDACGMKIRMCDKAAAVDFMINLPVLKGHCQTNVTCALKNNKGVIPNSEKRRFHTLGLHKPIAHLNTIARNDFILVDNICGDLDFEEGGNPVEMNRILAFRDPVLCDAFACETMGYSPAEVPYIPLAEALGVGSADISHANFIYLNAPEQKRESPSVTRRIKKLAGYTCPRDACSACYGSLIHALGKRDEREGLNSRLPKIAIGQGYRGQSGEIGIGQCTSSFKKSLKGCPPTAKEILEFLDQNWR